MTKNTRQPNPDEVICPNCTHQFPAIPQNVQEELARLRLGSHGLIEKEDFTEEELRAISGVAT